MSIECAILGILSCKSMTGYDIKKIIQDSAFMYWSGNNNQIYKALTEMHEKGYVTNEIMHQESSPTKKVYTITSEGLAALKEWVLSPSEPSEIKKPFLIQLAWFKQLNSNELNMLLDGYEKQVKIQLLMTENNKKDVDFLSESTALETIIWNFINENIRRTYENELVWIQDLRSAIANIPNENDAANNTEKKIREKEKSSGEMKYTVRSKNEICFVYFNDSETVLETERDILNVITALAENNTQFVLFDSTSLSKDFLKLKKDLIGALLQKFTMYNIKSAIIIKDMSSMKNKFIDSLAENIQHEAFRLFTNISDAEKWFLSLKHKGDAKI